MNSCQIFLIRFKEALSTRNYEILGNILDTDAKEKLQIVSTEHREFLVDGILDRRDGLLYFLNSVLEDYVSRRDSDTVAQKSFKFLSLLIDNFYEAACFKQYIHQIKEICYITLRKKCNFYIQKAASKAFIKLIERFNNHNLKLDETLKQFVKNVLPVNNSNERKLIYCVLGKIIKHSESVHVSYVESIFMKLANDALLEVVEIKHMGYSFHMYFDAISDILDNTKLSNKMENKLFRYFYTWMKSLCEKADNKSEKLQSSAIKLLYNHMDCFRKPLYDDYQEWHRNLLRLSREKSTLIHGQKALKTFYKVIGKILEEQDEERSQTVLRYFLDRFHTVFATAHWDLIQLQLIIFGYSQMVAPCKKHLSEHDVRQMYSTIVNYALPLCLSVQSDSKNIENVCCYEEALCKVLCHMSDVTTENINVLVKLSVYTIKRFPDLNIDKNTGAISSLIRIIHNLVFVDRNLLQRYLDNIIYDGIAWSCSHTLAVDAELQRELANLRRLPICYKNYLPLWIGLLRVDRYEHYCTVQMVAKTMTNVCMTMIDRLDIRVKQRYEDTVLSDVALTQSAVNQADFRVFTNLVDLYVDVMDASDASLYADVVSDFLREIVRLSYKYPLISGFYKLARVALKIFDCTTTKEEKSETKKLVSSCLANTVELLPTFSNELLIACLYLILDEPGISYVVSAVPSARLVPAFKIAFTIGLSDLELAYSALAALKTWTDTRQSQEDECRNESLREIVPHLESYLSSTESAVEMSRELTTTKKATLKRIGLIDTECTLRNFQRRVLLFLGSLDYDVLSSFLHERSLNTGASWDRKDLLSYTLLLPDARLTLHFDRTLPRVITLARSSSDRRTRIAACEVLHSMVALVIGWTARHLHSNLEDSVTLYAPLCPALLALGCDPDEVVRGLFQPLTLQLMHWLSSRFMLLSPVIPLLLNSLFDSLCDDANPSLREFAGLCLAEFTSWSIRQASHERDTQSNVHQVVDRINHFALHPSARKRVAAAVAFNHLYVILREDDDTVSIYWLEMLYHFVRSMDGCEDPSIANALGHIERVIRVKADLLNTVDRGRKKPQDFDEATLTHALYWLLSYCGVLDEHCRATCRGLYVNISQYVGGSAQETTRAFVEIYGMDRLNSIILKGLKPNAEDVSTDDIKNLLKALEYCSWLTEKQLLPVETLFPRDNDAQHHAIFACVRNFSCRFLRTVTTTVTVTTQFRELDELQTLRCKAVMATLNFVQMLLNVNDVVDVLPGSLWNESLFALTIKCVLHPRAIGFDIRNIKMTDELPRTLETLLNAMSSRFNDTLANSFKEYLSNSVQEYAPQLLNLHDIAQSDSCDEQIQYINGLMMFEQSIPETSVFANHVDTIERIFNFVVSEHAERLICKDLSAQMFEYLRALMKLQLLRHETSTIELLVRLISNDTLIDGANLMRTTHGEYFLNRFSDVIFAYVLTNVDDITFVLDKLSHDSPAFLLKWTEDALLHLKRQKRALREHVNDTVDVILRRFGCLESAVTGSNVDSHTERLIGICGTAVRLMSQPTEIKRSSAYSELHNWIVRQLIGDRDIEHKTRILRNFLVCLTDATDRVEDKRDLLYLYTLRDNRRSLCPQLSNEMTVNAMKVINCFETLLALLSATGSIVVLDCAMGFAAGAGKLLFNDKLKEHLRRYYCRETPDTNAERVLHSLEMTHQAFTKNVQLQERLDILSEFLLPAFSHCDAPTIERFFERNIRQLCAISRKDISSVSTHDQLHDLVSKIGCYQLLAIMCSRLEKSKLIDANGAIVRNSGIEPVLTGRELLQHLRMCALRVRALKVSQSKCREYTRLLHCSAYNFTLTIVSLNEKEEESVYDIAFGESRARDWFIWRNIVDCDKRYQLGQTHKDPEIRETNVNIKSLKGKEEGEASNRRRYSHIHSYDLMASSLHEDINAYDLNKCIVLPSPALNTPSEQSTTMSVVLEIDDFNEHECMPNIYCILLRFGGLKASEPPKWLLSFVASMRGNIPRNIRLFMLKIVNNTANDVFKPYAKFVLPGIAQAIADFLKTDDLNYIITDVLKILMDWRDDMNDGSIGADEVTCLFQVFAEKVLAQQQASDRRVYKYNLELLYTMAKKWRACLMEPIVGLIERMAFAECATLDLLIIVLCGNDGMAREVVSTKQMEDIVSHLLTRLRDCAIEENTERYYECLGWYLQLHQQGTGDEDAETRRIRDVKQRIFENLTSLRWAAQRVYIEKRVKYIAVLCKTCPDLAVDYITVVIDATTSAQKNRDCCLEIFALSMPRLRDIESIVSTLDRVELQSVLANRESSCEASALRIVRELVNTTIPPADLLSYVKLTIPYLEDCAEYRELAYDVLMSVYKKYSAPSDDENVTALWSESARKLLAALLDLSPELQARVLRFWTEETDLGTGRLKERLIAALSLRTRTHLCMSLKEEDAYALFVPLLILQLASRSRDYTEQMFDPLHNGTYEDYRIAVSWRRRNLSHVTPMFLDSFASQMSCSLSQSVDYDREIYNPHDVLRLRATQDLQFQPTLVKDEAAEVVDSTFDNLLPDDDSELTPTTSSRRSQPPPRRFTGLRNSDDGGSFRLKQIRKNVERQEMIKQEGIKQRNSVRLCRSYRNGDFPDIKIPHSSLIEPLQQLIKLDALIRKDITVSLIKETIESTKSDSFRRTVVENLKQILHDSERYGAFNAVILETLLILNVTDCDTRDIVRVSKTNDLNAVGVLLLERSLQPDASYSDNSLATAEKKMKLNDVDDKNQIDKWAQLASLYKSLDNVDAILSIFREQSYDKNVQEAAIASANGDWARAKMAFEEAYEPTKVVPSIHEYCVEGLFEAMDNLCDWSTIDDLVTKTNGDLRNVMDSPWRDWMIPRVCHAYVQLLTDNCGDWETSERDLQVIESWMEDPGRLEYIKPLVGEDLVIFLLKSLPRKADDILNDVLDKTGEQWVRLSPLCTELGMRKLRKLQVMSDLDATLKVFRYTDRTDATGCLDRMTCLLDFWTTKAPTTRDNLTQWNKLAACRKYSSLLFNELLDNITDDDNSERIQGIRTRMRRIYQHLRSGIVDAALKQKHQYAAQKHLSYLRNVSADLQPRQMLLEAKIKYLRANLGTDPHRRMRDYASSWKYSHQLLNRLSDDHVDVDTNIAVREHIGSLASTIERLTRESNVFTEVLLTGAEDGKILQDIGAKESDNLLGVRELLLHYSLDKFKSCSDIAATATRTATSRNVGEHYYALTKHCYSRLTDGEFMSEAEKNDIFQDLVFATLRAMCHDYHEATHYFPCLLRPEWLLRNGATRRTFEGECVKPQPWLFLRWRDLLFSHLGTPIASMVAPIVERLAETYPDAVAYTYLLAVEKNPAVSHDHATRRIRELLRGKVAEIEQFLSAIQYVVQPELYLKYHLSEATKRLSEGDTSALESLLSQVYKPISIAANERNPRPGSVYSVIAKHKDEIKALNPADSDATRVSIQRIKNSLDKSLEQRANKKRLKEYSPFLHAYAGGDIEIPGQYTGSREPMPRYHAKIARIEPIVEVMHSLRKPIRISMIGDNGREYKFLVKFGEDLAIDHGLQQLYATMNRTLSNDTACRQRRLVIDTYEVIPLSRAFGLIQWVEDTKSLEDLVRFTLSKLESSRCEYILNNYKVWIENAAPSSKRISDQYKAATAKYNQAEVVAKMKRLIGETKQSALRDAFIMVSPSPESFVTLRRNFVASYATMCAAHWISGIGDRHSQNTLVVVGSGRCLGIDFGHAFGSGIRGPVPELVPFRLTPQIQELLRPFIEKHLFSTIMTHVMRALRDDKGPILACMDIFIHKPDNRSSIDDEDIETDNPQDSTWLFKRNIMIVEKKLNGIHPSLIMLEQLKDAHNDEYFTRYQVIITGNTESTQVQAVVQNDYLTPNEQVKCLLDQATDLNILGRMYAKWQPWL